MPDKTPAAIAWQLTLEAFETTASAARLGQVGDDPASASNVASATQAAGEALVASARTVAAILDAEINAGPDEDVMTRPDINALAFESFHQCANAREAAEEVERATRHMGENDQGVEWMGAYGAWEDAENAWMRAAPPLD